MIKLALSLFLLISFTVSLGVCSEGNCSEEMGQTFISHCEQAPQSEAAADASKNHCLSHCSHPVTASVPGTSLNLEIEFDEQLKSNYLFVYQSPTVESIERPPLAS